MATATLDQARVRDIIRVLCRMPVRGGQLRLLHLLTTHSGGLSSAAFRKETSSDLHGQMGVMGALGRRINTTPRETQSKEKVGLALFAHSTWDGAMYTYLPRAELLEAIQRLPALNTCMNLPFAQVAAGGALTLTLPPGVPATPPPTPLGPLGPGPGPNPPQPSAPPPSFQSLLDEIAAAGLVFPSDLVANLLLALQVKRFVILTGISGTGKTQIARKIAARFASRRMVQVPADPGEGGVVLSVRPYMQKYHRMMLPAALAAQLRSPLQGGSSTLRTRWPGGEDELSIYTDTGTAVLFRAGVRSWFEAEITPSGAFLARVEAGDGARPDVLVLDRVPKAAVREEREENAVVVAVRPDWTDHRGLLGSYNPLTKVYLVTPFLRLLLAAAEEATRAESEKRTATPFFLILDEMNLARVEHYFADFLSAMESREPLHLHDSLEVAEGRGVDAEEEVTPVPLKLHVPPNLFFVGTVNVDESTYLFSPKVLDRAFTIELNATDLDGLTENPARGGDLNLDRWNGRLDPPAPPSADDWRWLAGQEGGTMVNEVKAFHQILARHGRHFGYRVATEIARFIRLAVEQSDEPGEATRAALDLAMLQKVLVKLHGTRQELGNLLDDLLRLAVLGSGKPPEAFDAKAWTYRPEEATVVPSDESSDSDAMLPRSAAKLWRMRERLRDAGFTSWIE